jgi:hypothetical protein
METLQDVFIRQALGDGSVAVVDSEALAKMTVRPKEPQVDRRSVAALTHELRNYESNFGSSDRQRKEADQLVNELTILLAKLVAGKNAYESRASHSEHSRELLTRATGKIEAVMHDLNDGRVGALADLDRHTRIAASRFTLLENWKASKPFEGAPTNSELLLQDREDEKFSELLTATHGSVRQPSVGKSLERAG